MANPKSDFVYLVSEFNGPSALLRAAEKLRDAGYRDFDCHSPYPIHGMDQAMGLKRSPLGYIVFLVGFCGVTGMIALTWWVSTVAYPVIISGKPLFSYPAYVPPIFAIGVLSGGITALLGMLALNKLPRPHHPLFDAGLFSKATDDGFLASVRVENRPESIDAARAFLESLEGKNTEIVND